MLMADNIRVVLASQSEARRKLLEMAGLAFDVVPSRVDEDAIRQALGAGEETVEPVDVAEILARAKAEDVARREVADVVIGADQVLALGDKIGTKPEDMDAARRQLLQLKGQRHELHTAVVIAKDDEIVWTHSTTVDVVMRDYSAAFVGRYLSHAGSSVLGSVGCYQLEGPGIQLIERFDGDYFSVLGLPLLPLLAELRRMEVLDN